MDSGLRALFSFAGAIIGLAIISVLFSPKATTASVLGTSGQVFAGLLQAAESPVTGTG
jgi:hypothetical protein